jgi:hypothetical protein
MADVRDPPEKVIGAMIDFSDRRPEIWPNLSAKITGSFSGREHSGCHGRDRYSGRRSVVLDHVAGEQINQALEGHSCAADSKLLTSALRFVSHPRPPTT